MPDPTALQAVLDRTGDPATVAWAHEGAGDLAKLSDPALAVAAAEKLGNAAALQRVTAPKDLRKAAAAALHRLKSRGVKVEEKVAPRAFALPKEHVDLVSRAFFSLPDQQGDLELLITASDDEGNCVLGVLLGPDGRVRESNHAHLNRSELRDLWKQAEGRPDHAEIPFPAGLHYAELWLGAGHHDWKHFAEHVPPGTLATARLLDPLARAPAGDAAEEEGNWAVPASLLDERALGAGVGHMIEAMASPLELSHEDRNARIEAIVAEAADAALTEKVRPAVARSAEVAALAFTFHRKAKTAARVAEVARAVAAGRKGGEIEAVVHAVRLALVIEAAGRMYREQGGGRE